MKVHYKALTIAGSDSSGGAGIQADLKTFSALGCYGMSVITALTAQNTTGVRSVHPVPALFVEEQLQAVLEDIVPDAVKIGMTHSLETIQTMARLLTRYELKSIVLDPVMISQSGDPLMDTGAVDAITSALMPLAAVVTPNIPEAEAILNRRIMTEQDMIQAAQELSLFGSQAILLKGGHLKGEKSPDILFISKENRLVTLEAERIETRNNHGTGCTLSSAIAAFLARGFSLVEAVKKAKAYLTEAIKKGTDYSIGHGHGPVHHFYEFW